MPDSSEEDRSISRGREYQSSGRGGAGNIRRTSASRGRPIDGPDDFSSSRGREYTVNNTSKIVSTGRGGAGNIRSPSRDPILAAPGLAEYEKQVIDDHLAAQGFSHSSGRGGIGNISNSRSRSRGLPPVVHSTGRGGVGNIKPGPGDFDSGDDDERGQHVSPEGIHSTGRGGLANLTGDMAPGIEHPPYQPSEVHSSGRGGIGNIRDSSREPRGSRTSSKDKKHGLLWNIVHHDAPGGSGAHESAED